MSQLRQEEKALDELGVNVNVVTFDADPMALAYVKETKLLWPLLLDSEQKLYDAYGMIHGSWWDIYNPLSIWSYIKLILAGERPGKFAKDWRQLGGDVLIDRQGIIRLHYVSSAPHDRPDVDLIINLVRDADQLDSESR